MAMNPHKYSRPFLDGAFEYEPALPIPFTWGKKPKMIFVDSMSDLFHKNISIEFIAKVYAVIFLTPQHTYQILTKRPERRFEIFQSEEFFNFLWKYVNQFHDTYIQKIEQELFFHDEVKKEFPFANVWEMTSTEDQEQANERIYWLSATPARTRGISAEPLLGEISFEEVLHHNAANGMVDLNLDWVITGGESGNSKRFFDCDWARSLRDQCAKLKINFFMKQVDKKRPIPEDLMVRQYPVLK